MPLLLHDEEGKVYLEHHQPEILPEEVRKRGVWVDEISAQLPVARGERAVLKVEGKAVKWVIEKANRLSQDEKLDLILERLDIILQRLGGS